MAKMTGAPQHPSDWVLRWKHLIGRGEVLDVACGQGRHTAMLRLEGRQVLACDIDVSDVEWLSDDPLVTVECRDLENEPWPWAPERFAGIIVTNYLCRKHFPHYWESLRPEGIFIMETFTEANGMIWGHPKNPDHFLKEGELLSLMPRGARLIAYEEGVKPSGWCVARTVWAKPGDATPYGYDL
ncbi:MAG: Methyltransf-11 domain-containing protein [Burkholderia sp.]|jgi:SAM-dependent methyltransferase